jgi:hypothetical protein
LKRVSSEVREERRPPWVAAGAYRFVLRTSVDGFRDELGFVFNVVRGLMIIQELSEEDRIEDSSHSC